LEKAPDAFRTISEVADEIDVPQHVLRFWESRFAQIRPMKRGGGRRYYRPDDVDLLRGVRHLLYGEGYTIRGVQRILREEGAGFVQNVWRAGVESVVGKAEEDEAADEAPARTPDRVEPNFATFGLRSARADQAGEGGITERREPVLSPPSEAPPDRKAAVALRTVLDELTACRQLIEAALSESDPAGPSAED
jgi:DNA-binding transcriptional MerR regulator